MVPRLRRPTTGPLPVEEVRLDEPAPGSARAATGRSFLVGRLNGSAVGHATLADRSPAALARFLWAPAVRAAAAAAFESRTRGRPAASRLEVSVVVGATGSPGALRRCLDGLARLARPPREIVVAATASVPGPISAVCAEMAVECLGGCEHGSVWQSGARALDTDLIAFIDDDCVPDPCWLADEPLSSFEDALIGALAGPTAPADLDGWASPLAVRWSIAPPGRPRTLDWASPPSGLRSETLLLRRDLLEAGASVQGLGGRPVGRSRRVELLLTRILGAGYRVRYDPSQLVWRHFPRSTASLGLLLAGDRIAGAYGRVRALPPVSATRPPDRNPAGAEPAVRVVQEAPKISVAISSYNRRDSLLAVLRALERQTLPPDAFEVVVVLDGSTDGSEEAVRAYAPAHHVRVVSQPNTGLAGARNRGVREAAEPVVLFLDDDIVPDPDLLAAHAAVHARESAPCVALGYCPPVLPEPRPWALVLRDWWEDHFRRKSDPSHRWSFIDFNDGNTSLRTESFVAAGGFDEAFRARRQDWDLGQRLLERHVRFRYSAAARGVHHVDLRFSTSARNGFQEARDDTLLASKHPALKGRLLLLRAARELLAEGSVRRSHLAARVWLRMPSARDRILARFEAQDRPGAGPGTLARFNRIVWGAYKLGLACELRSEERLVAFFGDDLLADPGRPWHVELTDGPQPPPEGDFPLDLTVTVGGRAAARLTAPEPGHQWDWEGLVEAVADASGESLGGREQARVDLLSALVIDRSAT